MNKKAWDLYAPIYKRAMKSDQKIYDFMYERIPEIVKDKEVLELATGPGLLAKHIAPAAKIVLQERWKRMWPAISQIINGSMIFPLKRKTAWSSLLPASCTT